MKNRNTNLRGLICWRIAPVIAMTCAIASSVFADNVPLYFFGGQQNFNGTVSVANGGTLQTGGSALGFETIPNQTIPLNSAPQSFSSYPASADFLGNGDVGGINDTQLLDINNLDLDFLNGATTAVTINQATVTGIPLNLFIGPVSGSLTGLTFTQTGASTVAGSSGTGTFRDPGSLVATLALNPVPVGIAPSTTLTALTLGNQLLVSPIGLTGNWRIARLGIDTKYSLDGSQTINVPLSVVTQLISTASAISMSAALNTTVGLAINYHFEIILPEPGSVVLLAIGIALLVPMVCRRRRSASEIHGTG